MAEASRTGWIRTVLHEVWGLFVEDGVFAAAILLWLGLIAAARKFAWLPADWLALLLLAGLIFILLESTTRHARFRR